MSEKNTATEPVQSVTETQISTTPGVEKAYTASKKAKKKSNRVKTTVINLLVFAVAAVKAHD